MNCIDKFMTPKIEQDGDEKYSCFYCEKSRTEFSAYPIVSIYENSFVDIKMLGSLMNRVLSVCRNCTQFQNVVRSVDNTPQISPFHEE